MFVFRRNFLPGGWSRDLFGRSSGRFGAVNFKVENAMKNKVVLITGANGGLGSSITRSFLAAGAAVTGVSNKISAEDFPQPNSLQLRPI